MSVEVVCYRKGCQHAGASRAVPVRAWRWIPPCDYRVGTCGSVPSSDTENTAALGANDPAVLGADNMAALGADATAALGADSSTVLGTDDAAMLLPWD